METLGRGSGSTTGAGSDGTDVVDVDDDDVDDDEVKAVGASLANLVRMASLMGEDSRKLVVDISDVVDVSVVVVEADAVVDVDAVAALDADDTLSSPIGSDSDLKKKQERYFFISFSVSRLQLGSIQKQDVTFQKRLNN